MFSMLYSTRECALLLYVFLAMRKYLISSALFLEIKQVWCLLQLHTFFVLSELGFKLFLALKPHLNLGQKVLTPNSNLNLNSYSSIDRKEGSEENWISRFCYLFSALKVKGKKTFLTAEIYSNSTKLYHSCME